MVVRPLSPELAEKARVELGEDPARLEQDLQHLKAWIDKQPHLRARKDDRWLIAFLRGSKYSLEKTKEKIDLYYSLRTTAPEFYSLKHRDPKFKEILGLGSSLFLPKTKNPTDPHVVLVRPAASDPAKYSITDVMAVDSVKQRIWTMENDAATVNGMVALMDLEGVTVSHFTQITPTIMKKMVVSGQDASPFRFKGGHYINTPSIFEKLYNFFKNMLNEKNRNRLHVHNKNYEELYKHIPKEILPVEYGGTGGTIADIIEYWQRKVEEYSDWLDEDDQYGTDESKRPGRPKTAEEMFGVEGSFRQLEFD